MEKNQQQMLSFLVMVMQSPGFLVQLLHPKENNWRMAEPGTIIEQGADEGQLAASDGMIIRYQPPQVEEMPTPMVSEIPQASNPLPDMRKDSFLSPDFVKLLMEENLSFENHAPLALPELPDDSAWEQFLLATPFLRNIDDTKHDGEGL
ncbi:heat stress transcription factor A-8-like [Jatropha curcas]|nr:heat stress transcription factor A-8-like [Jatropha curcas]